MEQNFTHYQNELVRRLYKELSSDERVALEQIVRTSSELMQTANDLQDAYDFLPKVKFNPSKSAIDNILKHSAKTAVASPF